MGAWLGHASESESVSSRGDCCAPVIGMDTDRLLTIPQDERRGLSKSSENTKINLEIFKESSIDERLATAESLSCRCSSCARGFTMSDRSDNLHHVSGII